MMFAASDFNTTFVDPIEAFDTVSREGLLKNLSKFGMIVKTSHATNKVK